MSDPSDILLSDEAALIAAVVLVTSAAFAPVTMYMVKRFFPVGLRAANEGDPEGGQGGSLDGGLAQDRHARWGLPHLLGGLIVYLFASVVISLGLVEIFGEAAITVPEEGASAEVSPLMILSSMGAQALILAVVAVYIFACALRSEPEGLAKLGFEWRGQPRAAGVGLLAYFVSFPGIIAAGMISPWVLKQFGSEYVPQPYVDMLLGLEGGQILIASLLAVVAIPFLEELVFRGFIQPVLVRRLGAIGGVVLTAALFGILHGVDHFLGIFALALVLGGVMQHTRRLGAAFAIHAVHNGTTVAFLILGRFALEAEPEAGLLALFLRLLP